MILLSQGDPEPLRAFRPAHTSKALDGSVGLPLSFGGLNSVFASERCLYRGA